jgi:hypothetical protein
MDNKLEKRENFRVEGSLDSDAVSKATKNNREKQKTNEKRTTPLFPNISEEEEIKRGSTESGNGASMGNP